MNTLLLSGGAAAVVVAIGAPLAWLLARTDVPFRKVALLLLGLSATAPLYCHAAAWQAVGGAQGWWTRLVGGPAWIQGFPGAIFIHAAATLPAAALLIAFGLTQTDGETEEQALLDAAPWPVFWYVSLPQSKGLALAAALWAALAAAGEMTVTNLMLIRTYAEEIYVQFALGDAAVLGLESTVGGIVATAGMLLAALLLVARLTPRRYGAAKTRPFVFSLGRWRVPLTVAAWTATLAIAGVPAGSLIYKAGLLNVRSGDSWTRLWSMQKSVAIVGGSFARFASEWGWSLLLAFLSASAALMLAVPLAIAARRSRPGRWPAFLLIALGFAVPGPVVGIALIHLFNRPEVPWLLALYDRSLFPASLAIVCRIAPLALLVTWHALAVAPRELDELAACDGVVGCRRFVLIELPNYWPGLAVAWLLAFLLALGDVSASILVLPPGVATLAIRLFGLIHFGVDDQVAGVSLALWGLVCCGTLLAWRLARRAGASR